LGHAWEGRSLLLGRAVPRQRGVHELQVYWQLGDALLGQAAPLPERIHLQPTAGQREQAQALRQAQGIEPDCIFICPFAGGTWNQQDKTWPGFADFVAQALPALGRSVVVCPGPGEEERIAREHFPGARLLPGVNLGVYTALLQDAGAMLSNDTGPGHLAAAAGTPLVSVMGPSDPSLWHPWGPGVQVLGGRGAWPDAAQVLQALNQALAGPR
jgi:heptosyltransferase-2